MKHMIRTGICLICLLGVSACETIVGPPGSEPQLPATPHVVSPPYDLFAEGEPNPGIIALKGGSYLWKIGNSWHLRVARPEPKTMLFRDVFTGSVRVQNGFVLNLVPQNARSLDVVQTGADGIEFGLEVDRGVRGFDFRVQPIGNEYCINVDVQVNGMTNPRYVYLGRSMFSPNMLPVRMCFRQ